MPDDAASRNRPLIVRCGAFGDMVLVTALIEELAARFGCDVDVVTSGPWSEPLLRGQPGVGEILSVRSRKTPYWLSRDQQRVVRRLRTRGPGPTWYCDGNEAARPLLTRAGFADRFVVDVKDHPLLPGEHATQHWRRLAHVMPASAVTASAPTPAAVSALATVPAMPAMPAVPAVLSAPGSPAEPGRESSVLLFGPGGCCLDVSAAQRADLERWLQARLPGGPLIAIQVGNKRTMRRGLRRLAANHKYWPNERWAQVLRHLRAQHPAYSLVLLGTGPEYELNQEVSALAGIERVYNLADDLPIPRLIALLARAEGLVTVDSGPAHAAAAVGCPQVVLFGRASTSLYRPWGTSGADVEVLTGHIDGEASMLGIPADAVMTAWDALRLRPTRAACPV